MADVFTKQKRSWIMARVRGRNTKPELAVRSISHRLGYRFRLDGAGLPGRPDLVFPRLQRAIFVHGCFWHGHKRCRRSALPSSNVIFWRKKLMGNVERDRRNFVMLLRQGWSYLVVWECQIRAVDSLLTRLRAYLGKQSGRR